LLTNERSLSRKIKEAILAYRINNVYSKDRILELYLNQIYLGNSSYGVTTAALNYFNKDLNDVTLDEAAILAALPKAPSILDPTRNPEKAKARRDWVITRMFEENFITQAQAEKYKALPINLASRWEHSILDNGYYTESVRLQLLDMYGEDKVYSDGLSVHTNINKDLQKIADDTLRQGLIKYDRKHGYKGPISNVNFKKDEWKQVIKKAPLNPAASSSGWVNAIVLNIAPQKAEIGLKDGSKSQIGLADLKWARKRLKNQYIDKQIHTPGDVLKVGDIIHVEKKEKGDGFSLAQVPDVNGGLVVMQPKTGRVLALVGGYSFKESKYNRVIQAKRQPGSTFKPFVYLAALENGFAANSILKDETITLPQGNGLPDWTPKNYEGKFLGDITLRKSIEKSRNLSTIYLLTLLGLDKVGEVSTRYNIYKNPPKLYSMALGANETTLLQVTNAFTSFASGGMNVVPKLIDRVHDRKGRIIYSSDLRKCSGCTLKGEEDKLKTNEIPNLTYKAFSNTDPMINYQLVSLLQGVVERGTGRKALAVGKILAGKTGTSNDSKDAWFIGFSPDLVCGIYVGYDNPKSLGKYESGASVALPIFIDFMKEALKDMPNKEFEVPLGIEFVKIDHSSGDIPGVFSSETDIVNEPMRKEEVDSFYSFFPSLPRDEDDERAKKYNLKEHTDEIESDVDVQENTSGSVPSIY